MPAMVMGSAAVFIDVDDCWKLLLVTRRGLMYIWDLYNRTCILQDSLASLVTFPDEPSGNHAGNYLYIQYSVVMYSLKQCLLKQLVLSSCLCLVDRCSKGYIC